MQAALQSSLEYSPLGLASASTTPHAPDSDAADLAGPLAERLDAARAIARDAGRILMRHFGHLSGYDEKSAIDLVSDADRESEDFVAAALARAFPDDLRIQEEAHGKDGARARRPTTDAAAFAWCVDPLDGTTNFVHAYPTFAVSIGLLHHGRPVLGVVHAPALGETYAGGRGIPTTRNGLPIRVSAVRELSRSLLATGFPYDRRERLDALLAIVKRAIMSAHDLRRAGSAALDLCTVAAGRLDGFFEQGLAPWDVVAGQAIVEAAGGLVTGYDGAPHDPYAGHLLATNGSIHAQLQAMVQA